MNQLRGTLPSGGGPLFLAFFAESWRLGQGEDLGFFAAFGNDIMIPDANKLFRFYSGRSVALPVTLAGSKVSKIQDLIKRKPE